MVAFDPLYVIDHHNDLLLPARSRFNEFYQNRVRWITITEKDDHAMLQDLPDAQMGFVMAWNFFHYKPFEVIKQYLTEIYQKLRPGGVFAFSINDGDLSGGVANSERMFMCYTPGSMIMSIGERIGFSIEIRHELDQAVTWIELQKSGERASLRGGQALAKIIPRPKPLAPKAGTVVDTQLTKPYTTEEREMLIQQAIDLNIDTPDKIRYDYSIEKLRTIIRKRKPQ
jgi:SAM-dependent methyltransferase